MDDPCHLALHPSGKYLLSTSSSKGTIALLSLNKESNCGQVELTKNVGLNPQQAVFDPSGKFVYVVLQGSDKIAQYSFDSESFSLCPLETLYCELPKGSDPRRLVFHPSLPVCYVLCQQTSVIICLSYSSETGLLTPLNNDWISTLSDAQFIADV